jgi:hypothetical protein
MWDNFLLDFLYLSSDLISGKSIPVLIAITVFPMDPHLLGTLVLMGATVGSLLNFHKTCRMTRNVILDWLLRSVHLSVGIWLSVSFMSKLLSMMIVTKGDQDNGLLLGTIPAFWVVIQGVPEKPCTLLVLFVLSFVMFYVSILVSPDILVVDQSQYSHNQRQLAAWSHDRDLQAISRYEWHKHPIQKHPIHHDVVVSPVITLTPAQEIGTMLPQSIYIFILTIYATTQHGPLYSFTNKYCSPTLLFHRGYALFTCFLVGLFRAYIYISIGWIHQNLVHIILEGESRIVSSIWWYIVVLLYSITWNITQMSQQMLTMLQGDPQDLTLRYSMVVFAIAYMNQWTQPTSVLIGMCVLEIASMALYVVFY